MRHNLSRRNLAIACKALRCYITQDRDGFVQVWTTKPWKNYERGIWEGDNDPKLTPDNPLFAPYTRKWAYSLITPKTYDMTYGELP